MRRRQRQADARPPETFYWFFWTWSPASVSRHVCEPALERLRYGDVQEARAHRESTPPAAAARVPPAARALTRGGRGAGGGEGSTHQARLHHRLRGNWVKSPPGPALLHTCARAARPSAPTGPAQSPAPHHACARSVVRISSGVIQEPHLPCPAQHAGASCVCDEPHVLGVSPQQLGERPSGLPRPGRGRSKAQAHSAGPGQAQAPAERVSRA